MSADDVLKRLRRWLGEPEPQPEKPPDPSRASIDELKVGMADIRAHLRRFGAALGAAATAILTGVGYTQLHEIFPLPADSSPSWLTAAAAACGALALIGAAWLAARFFAAQRRILLTTRQEPLGLFGWWRERRRGFGRRERDVRNEFFNKTAREYGAASLRALELRAHRLERAARRLPEAKKSQADALTAEAARIGAAVRLGLLQAAAAVLERRAHQAFKGSMTALPLVLTIAGLLGLFGLADWSQGQRELAALRKECAEASKAGAVDACEKVVPATAQKASDDAAKKAETEAKAKEAAVLAAAQKLLNRQAKRAVALASACETVVAADENLAGDAAKPARQAAVTRCLRTSR